MQTYTVLRCFWRSNRCFIRYKHKDTHWSVQIKKIHAIDKALEHFDDFYKQVYAKNWNWIRQGLLGKPKYVAVVNNYSDTERTITDLENSGALNVRTLFNLEKEYIKENYEKNKRNRYLDQIWSAANDNEVSDSETNKNQGTTNENDPKAKTNEDEIKEDHANLSISLEESLKDAEYDYSRIVDVGSGLAAPALLEFVPATKLKGKEDWITDSDHYRYYESGANFKVNVIKEYDIHFPEQLNVYCYGEHDYSTFKSPKKGITGVFDYYLMDGGSLLPVLALDLRPGNIMLDMCSAPGGKMLLALQTLYPDCVVCNDISKSRIDRIHNVLEQYFYDLEQRWFKTKRLKVTQIDGRHISEDNFDRILVDVPCTTDRHSLKENDNNIFKPSRIKERLKLPELQSQLLLNALKLVRVGGIVVYSTCTLSPIQNDGVVHMALKQLWEETRIEVVVKDLSPALAQAQSVYKLANQKLLKYGHLVLPCISQNYGPMYFCKLERIK